VFALFTPFANQRTTARNDMTIKFTMAPLELRPVRPPQLWVPLGKGGPDAAPPDLCRSGPRATRSCTRTRCVCGRSPAIVVWHLELLEPLCVVGTRILRSALRTLQRVLTQRAFLLVGKRWRLMFRRFCAAHSHRLAHSTRMQFDRAIASKLLGAFSVSIM
jgi:hypothetical protein